MLDDKINRIPVIVAELDGVVVGWNVRESDSKKLINIL
jgi:hypothetical protein